MVKFATNASGAMLLLNLIQVTESISGSVVPLAMFSSIFSTENYLTHRLVSDLTSSLFDTDMQGTMLGVNLDYVDDDDEDDDMNVLPDKYLFSLHKLVGTDYAFAETIFTISCN